MIDIVKEKKNLHITARCDVCCDIVLRKNYAIHVMTYYQNGRNVNLIIDYLPVESVFKYVSTYLIQDGCTVIEDKNTLQITCEFCYGLISRAFLAKDVADFEEKFPKND